MPRTKNDPPVRKSVMKNALDGTMRSTSDDESIREATLPPLRKSSPERKSPSPSPTQHRQKKRQKVTMSRTKNPPATVKKHVVKVATVEEPSSDDESVLGPAPPSQRELSPKRHSSPSPTQDRPKKRQKIAPLMLTDEQEEEIADWLKSNEWLYMKGKREYKDIAK